VRVCIRVVHAVKSYGGMEVELHSFLTVALDEVEWSASCLCCLTPREILLVLSTVYEARLTPELVWMFREKLIIWLCQKESYFSALQKADKFMHIHGH